MRAAAFVALFALCGCNWIVRHPPVAAAITGVTLGFVSCEIDSAPIKTCGEIAGIAGAALGGIALLVTLLFDTGQSAAAAPDPDARLRSGPHVRILAPPPIDAGVDAPPIDAAAATGDAPPP